jgi:competence protein ComEA
VDPFPGDVLPNGWRTVDPAPQSRPQAPEDGARSGRGELLAAAGLLVVLLAGGTLLLGPQAAPAVTSGSATTSGGRPGQPGGSGGTDGAGPAEAAKVDGGASAASASPALLVVDVAGAVRRPGLYRLPAGSRVGDAIAAAGGFGPRVDAAAVTASINLAERLEDGSKVLIPELGWSAAVSGHPLPATPSPPAQGPPLIDLNRATQADLEALPGIGPVTAKKIIDARASAPFQQPDDLVSRGVVGASVFEKIRGLVFVGP